MIPSTAKIKSFVFAALGLCVTVYAVTRLAPGLAAFVGLNPGGRALPDGSVLTLPNVNELMGRTSAPSGGASGQSLFSPFVPAGRNNIIDTVLA